MTYRQILDYLSRSERLGIKFGLSNIRRLLRASDFCYDKFRIIHITGTNGKGSVASFISTILREAGFKVGLYTSPHLVDFRERIQVDGKYIPKKGVLQIFPRLLALARTSQYRLATKLTYFEILTALALEYFSQTSVEIAVLEVGMGGRLDATNVFSDPLVSIITNVDLEHTEYLGKRISDIAREKAGIIKRDGIVLTGVKQRSALEVIEKVCRRKRARLFCLGRDFTVEPASRRRTRRFSCSQNFDYRGISHSFRNMSIRLLGKHQIENAALALATIEVLKLRGIEVGEEEVRKGFEEASWPGRMEVLKISGKKGEELRIVLDGAHNPAAMVSLKNALLERVIPYERIILVLGILKDKDFKRMVEEIVPLCQEVVVTSPKTERALDGNLLNKEVQNHISSSRISSADDVEGALNKAAKIASSNDLICVTGSLYTIGEAKRLLG